MKKDLKARLTTRKIKKPNKILMTLGMGVLGMLNRRYKVKFSYDYDPEAIKDQPTILLSSHASRLEFIYTIYGFGRKDINVVCGYQNILKRGLYRLFLSLGVISKYLYQPDLICVKHMIGVMKHGGCIGLFPEGIQATAGSTHPINPATAQFIKRSRANIVVATTKGAYLATNRYSKDRKRGYIGVEFYHLFTPEMLEELPEEEIYRQILDKISYNDFAYNKTARNTYVGKRPNADGIDKILYKCPSCGEERTICVDGDHVVCDSCGFKAEINECYDLVPVSGKCPSDIDEWYKWQRRCVAEEIRDDAFELSLEGSLTTLRTDKLKKAPNDRRVLSVGRATLNNRGFSFKGSLDGEDVSFDFDAKSIYSLTCCTQGFLEFYHNNDYFMLIPFEKPKDLIKWTLASEEIHNLYDERWRAACADVYDYDKGVVYE